MYDIFSGFFGLIKLNPLSTDNNVFRLHYKATTFVLILFSGLVIQRQYFGDPIDCLTTSNIAIADAYCWIQSTYTLPKIDNKNVYAHPGVYSPLPGKRVEKRFHVYYQWVALILLLQAGLFYLPHYIWKIWEGGKLKRLIEGMHLYMMDEKERETKTRFLVSYFLLNFNKQNMYAYKFIACEVLNFVNIIAQIFITDICVGYEFSTYGLRVLNETQKPFLSRHDGLEYVFPKVTKCTFSRFGPSGSSEKHDAICVLPVNVLIEKIYIFLWFWFIIIATVSGLALLYRLGTFSSEFRNQLMRAKAKIVNKEEIHFIIAKCDLGDWFLLYQIAKNMEENSFKSFISELVKELQTN